VRWFIEDPWGGGRGPLWRDSLSMAGHRLPLGYGPEVYTAAFPAYESARLARQYPDFSYESPHNMLLDALIAQGIPGLLAICALCWTGFRAARRAKHPAGLLLACALAAGVISQQFTVMTVPTALLILVVAALGVAMDGAGSQAAAGRLVTKNNRLSYVVAGIASSVFLVVAARLGAADFFLAETQRDLNGGRIREAAGSFAQHERWRLPGTSADLWYSRASVMAAQASGLDAGTRLFALAQYGSGALKAPRTAEEPFDAWYNASQYFALRNDAAGMEQALRAAIAARPNWFKPHWALAKLLALEHRLPEADGEAALARDLDNGAHAEVASTYREIHDARSATEPLHK